MTYASTATLEDLAARIGAAETIVCTSHEKPDGDAMGSVMGLVRALSSSKRMHAWLLGSVPPPIAGLARDTEWVQIAGPEDIPSVEPDLIILLDTGAWSQIKPLAGWLADRADRVIGIDHHASGDDPAPVRYVDATAASCTMLVQSLLGVLGIELDVAVAEPLFAGLATDTGWFRQANADAAAFEAASHLLATGVDKDRLFREIEETARPARLSLVARALASVQWSRGGAVATMRLTRADFDQTDGRRSDVTGLVNAPLVVSGAELSVLLIEERDGGVKASLRSKPPATPGGPFVDARAIAQHLGGGGHVHAAGVSLEGPIDCGADAIAEAIAAVSV
ncbi:MAG: DHH family phosphoesterase [Phycisphaerales bacterium]|jgi:phosphoesterase RecJ-like protein|nr:DHH family phosphoesterase [Phycisphaerales bacterium]